MGGVAVCPAHCNPPAACASCGLAIPRYRSVAPRSPSSRCCAPRLTPAKPSGVCLFRGIQPLNGAKRRPAGLAASCLRHSGGARCVCVQSPVLCVVPHPLPPALTALIVRETCACVWRGGSKAPPFPRPASARCASLPCPRLLAGGAGGRVPPCRRWGSRLPGRIAPKSRVLGSWRGFSSVVCVVLKRQETSALARACDS